MVGSGDYSYMGAFYYETLMANGWGSGPARIATAICASASDIIFTYNNGGFGTAWGLPDAWLGLHGFRAGANYNDQQMSDIGAFASNFGTDWRWFPDAYYLTPDWNHLPAKRGIDRNSGADLFMPYVVRGIAQYQQNVGEGQFTVNQGWESLRTFVNGYAQNEYGKIIAVSNSLRRVRR